MVTGASKESTIIGLIIGIVIALVIIYYDKRKNNKRKK